MAVLPGASMPVSASAASAEAAARAKRSSWSPSVSQEAKENQAGGELHPVTIPTPPSPPTPFTQELDL